MCIRDSGIAWLLQLAAELDEWDDPQAREWRANIRPLEQALVDRLVSWLPDLTYPVRSGTHSQTAFALGLGLGTHHGRSSIRTIGSR